MAILTLWCFSLSFCGATSPQGQSREAIGGEFTWKCRYRGSVAEVAQGFADVLHHRHVVLPAVLPELRGRELPPEENGHT